jgi:hypothetical protein
LLYCPHELGREEEVYYFSAHGILSPNETG